MLNKQQHMPLGDRRQCSARTWQSWSNKHLPPPLETNRRSKAPGRLWKKSVIGVFLFEREQKDIQSPTGSKSFLQRVVKTIFFYTALKKKLSSTLWHYWSGVTVFPVKRPVQIDLPSGGGEWAYTHQEHALRQADANVPGIKGEDGEVNGDVMWPTCPSYPRYSASAPRSRIV